MKIGLLPLYIKLYDDVGSDRTELYDWYNDTVKAFNDRDVEVVTSDFCRIKPEFEAVVAAFEAEMVDAIVTMHMAYSPSLESIDALTATKLPIIVLDTTPAYEFTQTQNPDAIGANHGIHGVMDMCSMLKRRGKPYAIAAGHYITSDVIDRVCGYVRAAVAAKALSTMRVGLIGGAFPGMGDFAVDPAELKARFGITVEDVSSELLISLADSITEEEIAEEKEANAARFAFADNIIESEYRETLKSCLTIRKLLDNEAYRAFSVSFLNINGLPAMPFIEACKAMERGIGYAGEGDALTASFTGAFLAAYPETSFVEIFCPDWKHDTVFLSHMGEMNYRIIDGKPLICRAGTNYATGSNPYPGYSRMKGGKGVYINVSRDSDDYQLLIASCEMTADGPDNFPKAMRGWMKFEGSTASFLENLSKNGATHHSSFIYGAAAEEIAYFGKLLGMKVVII
ncbi:MAG: hypothetical protein IJA85_04685 [Clostridia bacterium]|nr:hypothetical protein [Clostridia bacterium]